MSIQYEDLRQAWLAYRAEHGTRDTLKLLLAHGANDTKPFLDSVPEKNWPELMAALSGNAPVARSNSVVENRNEVSDDMAAAIYRKWNFGWKRPAR